MEHSPEVQPRTTIGDRFRSVGNKLRVPIAGAAALLMLSGMLPVEEIEAQPAPTENINPGNPGTAPNPDTPPTESMPTIGAPFYGRAQLGHTYRSRQLQPTANSYAESDESGAEVMAYYGDAWYHPYPAIDFKVRYGKALLAVTSGVIAVASEETDANPDAWPRRPGQFVILDPDDPRLPNFAYKHLSQTLTQVGQHVARGQTIARAGNSQSPNVHLHFDAHYTIEGFNTYPNQAPYGRMGFWECGRWRTLTSSTAIMGQWIHPQPTRALSLRNCSLN